jgi:hypothetical protein
VAKFCGRDRLFLLRGTSGKVGLRKGGMLVFVSLALHICCQLKLASIGLRIRGRDGGIDRHWPRLGAVTGLHEDFVKREFDSGTDDVKRIRGRGGMTDAFAVVHGVRDCGGRKEKGRGTKVGRKEGGEAKQSILKTSTGCGNGVLRIIGVVLSVVGVLVICRIGLGVFLGGSRPGDGTSSASDVVLELG